MFGALNRIVDIVAPHDEDLEEEDGSFRDDASASNWAEADRSELDRLRAEIVSLKGMIREQTSSPGQRETSAEEFGSKSIDRFPEVHVNSEAAPLPCRCEVAGLAAASERRLEAVATENIRLRADREDFVDSVSSKEREISQLKEIIAQVILNKI